MTSNKDYLLALMVKAIELGLMNAPVTRCIHILDGENVFNTLTDSYLDMISGKRDYGVYSEALSNWAKTKLAPIYYD